MACKTSILLTSNSLDLQIFESRPAHQPTKSTNSHSALPDSQSIERAQDGRKRKRTEVNESNPKFKEYIQVMLPKQTPEAAYDGLSEGKTIETAQASVAGEESDKEYEDVRLLKRKREATLLDKCPNAEGHDQSVMPTTQPPPSATSPADSSFKQSPVKSLATAAVIRLPGSATDDQWLRSRTSRQLDLVDIHEVVAHSRVVEAIEQEPTQVTSHSEYNAGVSHVLASEPSHGQEAGNVAAPTDSARGTRRLFVRNLPFAASSEDVREHFEVFGSVEEVSSPKCPFSIGSSSCHFCINDESPDRDNLLPFVVHDDQSGTSILVDASILKYCAFHSHNPKKYI